MNTQEKNDRAAQAKPVKRALPGIAVTTGVRAGQSEWPTPAATRHHPKKHKK